MREPEADRAQCRGGPRPNRVRPAAQRVTPERQVPGEGRAQQPGGQREGRSAPPTTTNAAVHGTAGPVRSARSADETRAVTGARGGDSPWVAGSGWRYTVSAGRR